MLKQTQETGIGKNANEGRGHNAGDDEKHPRAVSKLAELCFPRIERTEEEPDADSEQHHRPALDRAARRAEV
jgi:hypothetical protein